MVAGKPQSRWQASCAGAGNVRSGHKFLKCPGELSRARTTPRAGAMANSLSPRAFGPVSCPLCTSINTRVGAVTCGVCDGVLRPEVHWRCSRCTAVCQVANNDGRDLCVVCGCARDNGGKRGAVGGGKRGERGAGGAAPGDTERRVCVCGTERAATDSACAVCEVMRHTSRTSGLSGAGATSTASPASRQGRQDGAPGASGAPSVPSVPSTASGAGCGAGAGAAGGLSVTVGSSGCGGGGSGKRYWPLWEQAAKRRRGCAGSTSDASAIGSGSSGSANDTGDVVWCDTPPTHHAHPAGVGGGVGRAAPAAGAASGGDVALSDLLAAQVVETNCSGVRSGCLVPRRAALTRTRGCREWRVCVACGGCVTRVHTRKSSNVSGGVFPCNAK